MTWNKIIESNNYKAFKEKAEKQNFVYLLISAEEPFLPFDFAYSLHEIIVKYKVSFSTLRQDLFRGSKNNLGFYIEKVLTI